jgi:hypothetical protein
MCIIMCSQYAIGGEVRCKYRGVSSGLGWDLVGLRSCKVMKSATGYIHWSAIHQLIRYQEGQQAEVCPQVPPPPKPGGLAGRTTSRAIRLLSAHTASPVLGSRSCYRTVCLTPDSSPFSLQHDTCWQTIGESRSHILISSTRFIVHCSSHSLEVHFTI